MVEVAFYRVRSILVLTFLRSSATLCLAFLPMQTAPYKACRKQELKYCFEIDLFLSLRRKSPNNLVYAACNHAVGTEYCLTEAIARRSRARGAKDQQLSRCTSNVASEAPRPEIYFFRFSSVMRFLALAVAFAYVPYSAMAVELPHGAQYCRAPF
jgi:hypothetical protein